jgi:hypothetical protein
MGRSGSLPSSAIRKLRRTGTVRVLGDVLHDCGSVIRLPLESASKKNSKHNDKLRLSAGLASNGAVRTLKI